MTNLRSVLASRVSDPLLWSVIKRYPVLDRLAEWQQRQWDDPIAFRDRQDKALADLLSHALSQVPFYRGKVPGITPESVASSPRVALASFPVLEKRDVRSHIDSLTCEMARGTFENLTGGSTGEPVRFRQDGVYLTNAIAATMLFYQWAGIPRGASQVKLWGAPRDLGTGNVARRRRVADWLFNRITLDAFDMSESSIRSYAEKIARSRPLCIEGYADALHQVAIRIEGLGIRMNPPSAIVSSAGTLSPQMREAIESAFGAKVFDRYGAREVGGIAAECDRHQGLHVFGETGVVEIVDGDGFPVSEGEEGEVLVTALHNFTMPMIRYRIGDRAVRGGDLCGCGRPYPLLERVAGRSESCIRKPGGGVVLPEFFIHVIGVEYNDGSIERFQVVQESIDRITVVVVPSPGAGERALARESEMRARIRQMVGECEVSFVLADSIKPTPTGKYLYVVSKLGESE